MDLLHHISYVIYDMKLLNDEQTMLMVKNVHHRFKHSTLSSITKYWITYLPHLLRSDKDRTSMTKTIFNSISKPI